MYAIVCRDFIVGIIQIQASIFVFDPHLFNSITVAFVTGAKAT